MHHAIRQSNGKEYEKFQLMIGGEKGRLEFDFVLLKSVRTTTTGHLRPWSLVASGC
jgi:hypothetical protein